jgi:lipoprotein-anchoring transpeptidase ErfK/SrfK
MIDNVDPLREALENARICYYQGNHSKTRYWARLAASINPNIEEPWLWLAAVSSPRASIAYLQKAISVNPHSKRARLAMHWAVKRVRVLPIQKPSAVIQEKPRTTPSEIISEAKVPARKHIGFHWWALILVLLVVITTALVSPAMGFYFNALFSSPDISIASQNGLVKASNTPTPSNTPTITPSPTPTKTPTPTLTDTPSATPTDTASPTDTPYPTDTIYPTEVPTNSDVPSPGGGERWIDVDLSKQMTYAYEGDQIVASFLVSTGTWQHPTVTGQFHIYVKYLYADMAGPGYYLPNVPYVMYFYDGYGLHGTYWHHNFGTPMSHGCINLTIPDAEWLFYWADVGTLVNIHE